MNNYPSELKPKKIKDNSNRTLYNVNHAIKKLTHNIQDLFVEGANVADIDLEIYKRICKTRYYPSMLGHEGFPNATSISVNNQVCHTIPKYYILRKGDIIFT